MTSAEMRKRIVRTYMTVRNRYRGLRLTINSHIPYVALDAQGGKSLMYMQGEEADDFISAIDKISGKFNVDYDQAAVYYLDSAGFFN